ncbi:MAG TPA: hypothetical protein VHW47_10320 [Acidimicrobiales bacterium]|nr:hypothetical protein [Acidimicrobiales bacterium]
MTDQATTHWCEGCDALVDDDDLFEDGTCPTCGTQVTEPMGSRRIPWYFKFMILASVIYLGYRAFQGITWIAHHV